MWLPPFTGGLRVIRRYREMLRSEELDTVHVEYETTPTITTFLNNLTESEPQDKSEHQTRIALTRGSHYA